MTWNKKHTMAAIGAVLIGGAAIFVTVGFGGGPIEVPENATKKERLIIALKNNNCRMAGRNPSVEALLKSVGLTFDDADVIAIAMIKNSEVKVERGTLVLLDQTDCRKP